MSIKFACTECEKAYKVPDKYAGKKFKCKACGATIRVPKESASGVSSKRAAAVSKRSLAATSGRSSSKSERSSSKSGRSSKSKSGRSKRVEASGSGKSRRSTKAKKAKPGADTERFKPVDLQSDNKVKDFQTKKAEEFDRGEGRLTYFENGKPVKAFRLSKTEAVIGRGEDCGICLPLSSISREHSKIEYKLGTFIATDLKSKNGLMVNGRTVRRVALRSGDIIQVGQGILRIDC